MGIMDRLRGFFARNGAYDGGGWDRRNRNWSPVDGSGERVNQMSRDVLRLRARDLERNSDNVAALVDAFERNVVGTGMRLQAKVMTDNGEEDETVNQQIEALWNDWCRYECCDITGQFCFSEMQRMAVRRRLVDGGLFFVLCVDGSLKKEHSFKKDGKVPLRLQMKEVDELDTSVSDWKGRPVVAGVELDRFGRAVAYHFKGYDRYGFLTGNSVRLPAEDVIYLSWKTRPSEVRELTPLAKIITRLRDLNQFVEAVSVKERVLACLSVFVKKINPGGFGRAGRPGERESVYRSKTLTPGMITELDAGDDVAVVNPSGQASNAREFVTMMLRSIGSALGISYEATSRDMSQVNYSSARQGLLDDQKTYRMWQEYLIEHFCKRVYREFMRLCVLTGALVLPDYFGNEEKYIKCTFIPNGQSWIDPQKEVNANVSALNSCQTTLEEICAGTGKDYREVIRQRAKELALMKELGINGGENSKADETQQADYSEDENEE